MSASRKRAEKSREGCTHRVMHVRVDESGENVASLQRLSINQHRMRMNDGDGVSMLLTVRVSSNNMCLLHLRGG